MLPIKSNTNQAGCNPVSSNCVIYQGPDIPCLTLCKGDTVSDVIAKLAEDLCDLMDQFDIDSFDLTCFNPICPTPENTHDLIQYLVTKVCELEGCCDEVTPGPPSGCPDCTVNIAPCFYFNNDLDDLVTTMQLQDYVTKIGNRLCSIVTEIATLQATVTSLSIRVNALEQVVIPVPVEPLLPSSCLISPTGSYPLSVVLLALEGAFCNLQTATGLPGDIIDATEKQCVNLTNSPSLASPGTVMGLIPNWEPAVFNLAQSINNMWLTICDLRGAILDIQANCCPIGCDGVVVTIASVVYNGTTDLEVFLSGNANGFSDCTPVGSNTITITDLITLQTTTKNISVLGNIGFSFIVPISPLNQGSTYSVVIHGCFIQGTNQCQQVIEYNATINSATCPDLIMSLTTTEVGFSFTSTIPGVSNWTVNLLNSDTTPFQTMSGTVNFGQTIDRSTLALGAFAGTSDYTNYIIQVGTSVGLNLITYCDSFNIQTPLGDYLMWGPGVDDFFINDDGSYFLIQ